MVSKKGLKKNIFNHELILIIFTIIFLSFVFAVNLGGQIINPLSRTNHSGLINITCNSTGIYGAINATVYYNITGGEITTSAVYKLGNDSNRTVAGIAGAAVDNVKSINVSINTASFPDSTTYNLSCTVCNVTIGTGGGVTHCWNVSGSSLGEGSTTNVTFDNIPPRVENLSNPIQTNGIVNGGVYNGSKILSLNVSVNDSRWNVWRMDTGLMADSVYFNVTNTTENMVNFTPSIFQPTAGGNRDYGAWWNATMNIAGFQDGLYNITVWANQTDNMSRVEWGHTNSNNTESIQIYIDNTGPSLTYTCSPNSVVIGQVVTCTCKGSDATSGINYTSDGTTTSTSSAATINTEITTTAAGTFTRTCTVRDRAYNSTSATATYTVTTASSGGSTTSGGTTVSVTEKTSTLPEIISGEAITVSAFAETTAVEEIKITVKETASDVKVTVRDYDTKPTAVSVAKTGKVNKYLQIETENLLNKLETATVTFKAEKSWATTNSIDKANIAIFKYDETANKWNELSTVYKEEDNDYYYYDVQLTSFSYFAIGDKSLEEPGAGEEEEGITANLTWLWIVIGVVVLAAIIGGGIAAGKKKRR